MRRGHVYCSDVLYRLTSADGDTLRALGIRTVIDLRSRHEVEHYPESPLVAAGIQHVRSGDRNAAARTLNFDTIAPSPDDFDYWNIADWNRVAAE